MTASPRSIEISFSLLHKTQQRSIYNAIIQDIISDK